MLPDLDGHAAVAVAVSVVLLMLRLPPIVMRVALLLRCGAVVADGGITTGLVHVLMGIRAILLGLRLTPCGIVVAATDDAHAYGALLGDRW